MKLDLADSVPAFSILLADIAVGGIPPTVLYILPPSVVRWCSVGDVGGRIVGRGFGSGSQLRDFSNIRRIAGTRDLVMLFVLVSGNCRGSVLFMLLMAGLDADSRDCFGTIVSSKC